MPLRLCRYVVKNNLFDEPVRAFLANGDTPNLLNSTFLEMIEFIRQADTKIVMLHFVDEYWPRVKNISYVRTFKLLKDAADNARVRAPCVLPPLQMPLPHKLADKCPYKCISLHMRP